MTPSTPIARLAAAAILVALAAPAMAQDPHAAVEMDETGKHFDAEGTPTFNVNENGEVDWYTYSGFRRYHSECHVCHGPDGMGSTYAPALKDSALNLEYWQFAEAVAAGIKNVGASENQVMPAFGTNPNVMCYLDDIYVYLRARGAEAVDRGRPAKKVRKSEAYDEAEDACMG